MVNTAQSLTAAVETGHPDMILMTGCAGAFAASGMKMGDIGIATGENDAHLGIESETRGELPAPLPFDLEVMDGVSVGSRIAMDLRLAKEAVAVLKDGFRDVALNVIQGPFITVSTVTATDGSAARLYERHHACMESMEGSAGAHVAMHYRIPFVEIRCASNLVGKRSREGWDIPLACRRSGEAAVMWIRSRG
jgi:futalosine hydrolase